MTFPTERDFQHAVVDLARLRGCLVHLNGDSRRATAGLPDLIIIGRRGVLWRELKTERGRLRDQQEATLSRLLRAHQDAAVWRPSDWPARVRAEIEAVA